MSATGRLLPYHTACKVGPDLHLRQRLTEVGLRNGRSVDPRRRRSAPREVASGDSLEDRAR